MTAEVITLYEDADCDDDGALDAIAEYFYHVYPARMMERLQGVDPMSDEEHFSEWLANAGYVVVPLDGEE